MRTRSSTRRLALAATSTAALGTLLIGGLPANAATTAASNATLPLVARWSDGGSATLFGGFAPQADGRLTTRDASATSYASAQGGAAALEITPGAYQPIRNSSDNTCLELAPGWGGAGQWDVVMDTCDNSAGQIWDVDKNGTITHGVSGAQIVAAIDGENRAHLTARLTPTNPARLSAADGTAAGKLTLGVTLTPQSTTVTGTTVPRATVAVTGTFGGQKITLGSTVADGTGAYSVVVARSILSDHPDVDLAVTSTYLGQSAGTQAVIDAKNTVVVDGSSSASLVTGTAQKGAVVQVTEGTKFLASARPTADSRSAGDGGRYSIALPELAAGTHTLTVSQTQLGSSSVTSRDTLTVTVAGSASPAVYRIDRANGERWTAGFAVTADGHLVSTNAAVQDAGKAGKGAMPLVVERGTGSITDATGKKCLTDAVADAQDRRVTLAACNGRSNQLWTVSADGATRNPATRTNLTVINTENNWTLASTLGASEAKFTAAPDTAAIPFSFDIAIQDGELLLSGTGAEGRNVAVSARVGLGGDELLYASDVTAMGHWYAKLDAAQLKATSSIPVTATQRLFGNDQSIVIPVDAKNVVTIGNLSSGSTLGKTVTGAAVKGQEVVLKEGGTVIAQATATAASGGTGNAGVYSIAVPALTAGSHTLTVEQAQNARLVTRSIVTVTALPATQPFAVTSHGDGATYTPGVVTFTGTGLVGATITAVNQWGTAMTPAGGVKVGTNGTWTFTRNLGPTADYEITFSQNNAASTTLDLLAPRSKPFAVTSHGDGATYTPGVVTFTGTGLVGATITAVNQWGTAMTPAGGVKVGTNGTWTFTRNLGPTATYVITFTQDGTATAKVTLTPAK